MSIEKSTNTVAWGWDDIISVCGHSNRWDEVTIGVRSDGTVSLAGDGAEYYDDILNWNDISEIVMAGMKAMGLKKDGTAVFYCGSKWDEPLDVSDWTDIKLPNR